MDPKCNNITLTNILLVKKYIENPPCVELFWDAGSMNQIIVNSRNFSQQKQLNVIQLQFHALQNQFQHLRPTFNNGTLITE